MIIDVTDFSKRPYKVPNQQESPDFPEFVEAKEIELATRYLLGWDLWEEFIAALEASGDLDAKWEALRDGAMYDYNGVNYKYEGWISLIRPGIYSDWLPMISEKLTNVGMIQNASPKETKFIEDQYPFQIGMWNKFVKNVGFHGQFGYNYKNTFYGFMKANEADYDNWVFRCPPIKNRFDI
jgi:hypothetical protein